MIRVGADTPDFTFAGRRRATRHRQSPSQAKLHELLGT